jgi:rod shape-determining protein MreC
LLRFLKNKIFWLVLTTVLVFVVIGFSAAGGGRSTAADFFSVPFAPVQRFFSGISEKIGSVFIFFRDINELKRENEALKEKVAQLEKDNRELIVYKEKTAELRKALNLKAQFENYEVSGANVIAKDPGNWFDIFMIDVGTREGVSEGMSVVTAGKSLVGRILNSDYTSSRVISIIDMDSVVSGWISKPGGGHVVIRGDIALKNLGLCKMDYIPLDVDVSVDDVIETSGLGGIYPKGLLIGSVSEVLKTDDALNRYAIIKPSVDLKKLEEVFVLIPR